MKHRYTPILSSSPLEAWFNDPFFGMDFPNSRLLGLGGGHREVRLSADFYEDDENYFARVELPGVKKDEVKIELDKNVLNLSYERKTDDEEHQESSSYHRSIRVPEGIDADKISAKLEDGLLTITLPKGEDSKPREITVN